MPGCRRQGVAYDLSPRGGRGHAGVHSASASGLAPAAYRLQGYRFNRVLFDATADRLSQAIAGQITRGHDQAYDRHHVADVSSPALAAAQLYAAVGLRGSGLRAPCGNEPARAADALAARATAARRARIGWLFVAPNLAVFALFTFLPIAINVHYAVTGGTALLPSDRPFTGAENMRELLACENHFDPNTCTTDLFWFGIWNTLKLRRVAGRPDGRIQPAHSAGDEPQASADAASSGRRSSTRCCCRRSWWR